MTNKGKEKKDKKKKKIQAISLSLIPAIYEEHSFRKAIRRIFRNPVKHFKNGLWQEREHCFI